VPASPGNIQERIFAPYGGEAKRYLREVPHRR
jgi:hypothetical protein